MALDKVSIILDQAKTGIICVDAYDNKLISGRLHYKNLGKEKPFDNLIQLLFLIEQAISAMAFPDAYSKIKHFSAPQETPEQSPLAEQDNGEMPTNGKLATFAIKILFKQNSSWQGTIAWVQGRKEETFRSVFEMIMLMDSALERKETKNMRDDLED